MEVCSLQSYLTSLRSDARMYLWSTLGTSFSSVWYIRSHCVPLSAAYFKSASHFPNCKHSADILCSRTAAQIILRNQQIAPDQLGLFPWILRTAAQGYTPCWLTCVHWILNLRMKFCERRKGHFCRRCWQERPAHVVISEFLWIIRECLQI